MELFENADGGGGMARYPSKDGTSVGVGSGVGSMIRDEKSKKIKGGRVDVFHFCSRSSQGLKDVWCVCVCVCVLNQLVIYCTQKYIPNYLL